MSDEGITPSVVEPDQKVTQGSKKKVLNRIKTFFIVLIFLAQIGFTIFVYVDKEKQIKGLKEYIALVDVDLKNTLYQLKNPDIDLTAKMYQPFSTSYGILIQGIKVLPNGKTISGRIVNFDSVTVSSVALTFMIGSDSKDFVVDEISPGGSRKFEVTVEGADALSKNTAKVIWNGNNFY